MSLPHLAAISCAIMRQMESHLAVQDTYPADFAHCYGCGRYNESGHRIKTFQTEDGTITTFDPPGIYTGAGNFAYGGILASLIDCHSAGSAAIFWMQANGRSVGEGLAPRFVTGRLEVDFVAPTPLEPLVLAGHLAELGQRKVVVTTELSCSGQVTVRGRAVLVKVSDS